MLALSLPDAGNQGLTAWIGDLVELLLQRGHTAHGIYLCASNVLMSWEALHVGNIHAQIQKLRRNRMPQQVRIDPLVNAGRPGHSLDDLTDALSRILIRPLPTSEQWSGPAVSDVNV